MEMATPEKILNGHRTIGETSLDTKRIYEMLATANIGDVVMYQDMSAAIGREVHKVWQSVTTARNMALREIGAVFSPVRGHGLKKLSHSEIAQLPEGTIMRIRRMVGREARRQAVVDENSLSNQEKITRNARLSVLGALTEFTKPAATKRIEAQASTSALFVEVNAA